MLFSFLTTEPNAVAAPVHAAAMPVILTGADCDLWPEGETPDALKLQRPWPAEPLKVVARPALDRTRADKRFDGPRASPRPDRNPKTPERQTETQ